MNRALLVSVHGAIAGVMVAALVAFGLVTGALHAPHVLTRDRPFLLTSGWVTLALFIAAYGYVLRKYAHKRGYSPEFALKMPRRALEEAETQLNAIRYKMALGTLTGEAEILERSRAILRQTGCDSILRVRLESGAGGMALVTSRTEPLKRMARWLHAHIYYGFAAGVLTLVHGGVNLESPMWWVLGGTSILVVSTGVVGLWFWMYGPAWLTRLERDLTTEEVFVLARHYDRRVAEALVPVREKDPSLADAVLTSNAANARALVPRLAAVLEGEDTTTHAHDLVALAGQRQRVRAEHARLSRARFTMNAWRLVHIPASIALLAFILVHVFSVWLY